VRGRWRWRSSRTTACRWRSDHPRGRPVGADLDGGQGGLGHQQHEVRAQRRAHASARSTAPTSRSATAVGHENFFLFGLTPRGRGRARRGYRPAAIIAAARRWTRCSR
jgi:hypothetical protein